VSADPYRSQTACSSFERGCARAGAGSRSGRCCWEPGAASCALLFLMFVFAIGVREPPPIDSLRLPAQDSAARIWSSDGVLLGEFGEARRSYVPIAEVPQKLKDAILSAEDVSFYRHSGVDFVGLARQLWPTRCRAGAARAAALSRCRWHATLPELRAQLHPQAV